MAHEDPGPAGTQPVTPVDARAGAAGAAPSPPDAAVEHGDDEGRTPAAWTACGGVMVASVVGAFAVVLGSWLLGAAAAAITVAALLAGYLMSRASGREGGGVHGDSPESLTDG
ncbi:MAG: HGxxPAAW family protein [Kineosporiaceae bacterium]